MDGGWLVPFMWDPVLPGDTYNVNTTIFARLSTPLFPIMDNTYLDTHFFYVPYRLLWDNFRKFCGEQTDPGDSIDYQIPIMAGAYTSDGDPNLTLAAGQIEALMNYLGVPHGVLNTSVDISAMPFRAYDFIYNEWFRDQNLIDSQTRVTGDGPDTPAADKYLLRRRGKRHDYFCSALPWPQKPDTLNPGGVTLPLSGSAPIHTAGTVSADVGIYSDGNSAYQHLDSGAALVDVSAASTTAETNKMYADLTNATAATVDDLREAFQVQKLLTKDARGGTRYSEIVRNHFGVTNFYDLSYRPEYLGGSSSRLNVNPVASTDGANTGDLRAFATGSMSGHGFTKSFAEHGLIMGFISARADLTYQTGLSRHFSHSTRYDIYWPSLAFLGEQAILNKEIWCDPAGGSNDDVFGYIPRYDEYRYKPSQISGLFQSAVGGGSLDPWHLSQEFGALPTLGQTFIEEDPPFDRVIATPTEPHFIVDTYTKMICARPMPVNAVPGMIDHF